MSDQNDETAGAAGDPAAGLAIALERIHAEEQARTGRLDLGNLGLSDLPEALWGLDWLAELVLGGAIETYRGFGRAQRRGPDGDWEETDEPYRPNALHDLAPITRLGRLRVLDCSGARLSDLAPLAGLTALRSLVCSLTQVSDLAPLAGLTNLEYLDCYNTKLTASPPSRPAWPEDRPPITLEEMEQAIIQGASDRAGL